MPLDFNIKLTQGTVVPQRRWNPADEFDIRRFVVQATLQLPIFFVHLNGGVGFWLPDILQDRDRNLCDRDSEAPLGGTTTTHIRINVSPHDLLLTAMFLTHVCRLFSQWPGYDDWRRQIPTRDATFWRNPITLGRFMKHVATSVDRFFNVRHTPFSFSHLRH
jgi:hypothetical protein